MDQASTLRMMTRKAGGVSGMQIYSITSGKGGVGKTSVVCNMACRFGQLGQRVLLIDADMGLANVDIVMGLQPRATLADLFNGDAEIEELIVDGPPNVSVLPSSSGVQALKVARIPTANSKPRGRTTKWFVFMNERWCREPCHL